MCRFFVPGLVSDCAKALSLTRVFPFPQENLENGGAWKQGTEPVLQNGLRRGSRAHASGCDPKDKGHDNMAFERITRF